MRWITKGILATLLAASALGGCATPPADPMADLKAGKLNLMCGIACSLTWGLKASSLQALDASEHWPELAAAVMNVGYGNDLSYYYLGQAAQGLGYDQAAIGYYNFALALTSGTNPLLKCSGIPGQAQDQCQGVDLATSLPVLIKVSHDRIQAQSAPTPAAPVPSRAKPVHHHHVTPPPGMMNSSSSGSGFEPPPPPASSTPSSTPASGGSGFEAPPPPPTDR